MSYQPGIPRLSADDVHTLNAPGNEVLRREWLDWLALVHSYLAMYSQSAPRPYFADEESLNAQIERQLGRLEGTSLYDRAVLGKLALGFVRRVAGEHGPGEYLNEVVNACVADVVEQYNFLRSYPWVAGVRTPVRGLEGRGARRASGGM